MKFVAFGASDRDRNEYINIYTEEGYERRGESIVVISVTSCEYPANHTVEAALCNAIERFINTADFELELKK